MANESGDGTDQDFPDVCYDTSLPAQHAYLGTDLEELSGRIVLDDNSFQCIPLLPMPGVVLIPGQTLPLQLFHPVTISMMRRVIDNDRTFGLINSRFSGRVFSHRIDLIGTTAEIRSYREEEEVPLGLSALRIKAEGRQRFQVLETYRQTDGTLTGKVRILPEVVLGDPGEGAKLKSLDRFALVPPPKPKIFQMKEAFMQCKAPQKKAYNKYDFANYTYWPAFVYKQYDPQVLMKKIKAELQCWNRSLKSDCMPCNPVEFSFWVAANLPLNDNQKLSLLSLDNAIQRLHCELNILEKYSVLQCRDCGAHIAGRTDIFSMSLQGPQGTYVNPNGYVHETITVYRVKGLSLIGRPSTDQSWFPGYSWTIVECSNCQCHMGWMYLAVKEDLQPTKFWGLCRSSLKGGISSDEADSV